MVVTTYEMLKNPAMKTTLVSKLYWRCFVLDEGHVIKNVETEMAKACRKVHFQFGLLLTGTPLQNNLTELWALLNFLFPEIFEKSDAFPTSLSRR